MLSTAALSSTAESYDVDPMKNQAFLLNGIAIDSHRRNSSSIARAHNRLTTLLSTYFYSTSPHIWAPPSILLSLRHVLEKLEDILFQLLKYTGDSVCIGLAVYGLEGVLQEIRLLLIGQRVEGQEKTGAWWEGLRGKGEWEFYQRGIRKVEYFVWIGRSVLRVVVRKVPVLWEGEKRGKTEQALARLLDQHMELYRGKGGGVGIFERFEELKMYDGDSFVKKVKIEGAVRVWVFWAYKAIMGLQSVENDQAAPPRQFLDLLKVAWIYKLLRNYGRLDFAPPDLRALMADVSSELIITMKEISEQHLAVPDVFELMRQGEWKILLDEGFEEAELEVQTFQELKLSADSQPLDNKIVLSTPYLTELNKQESETGNENNQRAFIDEKILIEQESYSQALGQDSPVLGLHSISSPSTSSLSSATPKSSHSPSSSITSVSDFELPPNKEKTSVGPGPINRITTIPIALDLNPFHNQSIVVSPLYETYKEIQATLAKQRDSSFEELSPVYSEKSLGMSTAGTRALREKMALEINDPESNRPNEVPSIPAAKQIKKSVPKLLKDKELPPIPGEAILGVPRPLILESKTGGEGEKGSYMRPGSSATHLPFVEDQTINKPFQMLNLQPTISQTEKKPNLLQSTISSVGGKGKAWPNSAVSLGMPSETAIGKEKLAEKNMKRSPRLPLSSLKIPVAAGGAGGSPNYAESSKSDSTNQQRNPSFTPQVKAKTQMQGAGRIENVNAHQATLGRQLQSVQRMKADVSNIRHETKNLSTPSILKVLLPAIPEDNRVLEKKEGKKSLIDRARSRGAISSLLTSSRREKREEKSLGENRGRMNYLEEPQIREEPSRTPRRGRSRDGKQSRFIKLREIAGQKAAAYAVRLGEIEVATETFARMCIYISETGLMMGRWEPVVIRLFRDIDNGSFRIVMFKLDGTVSQLTAVALCLFLKVVDPKTAELVPEWAYHGTEVMPLLYIRRIDENLNEDKEHSRRDSNRSSFGCVGDLSTAGFGGAISPFWRFKKYEDLFAFQSAWTGEVAHSNIPLVRSLKYSFKKGLIPHEHIHSNARIQFWTEAPEMHGTGVVSELNPMGIETGKEPLRRVMIFVDEMIMTLFVTENVELETKASTRTMRIKPAPSRSRVAPGSSLRAKLIGKDATNKAGNNPASNSSIVSWREKAQGGLASTTCGAFRLDKEGLGIEDECTGTFKDYQWMEIEFCDVEDMSLFFQAFRAAQKDCPKDPRTPEPQIKHGTQLHQGYSDRNSTSSHSSRVSSNTDSYVAHISTSGVSGASGSGDNRASSKAGSSSANSMDFSTFGTKTAMVQLQHARAVNENYGEKEAGKTGRDIEIDAAEILLGISPGMRKKKPTKSPDGGKRA